MPGGPCLNFLLYGIIHFTAVCGLGSFANYADRGYMGGFHAPGAGGEPVLQSSNPGLTIWPMGLPHLLLKEPPLLFLGHGLCPASHPVPKQ